MLSIFSIPKPFVGHNNIIQRNALQSWIALNCSSEIFLFGDDYGVADTAKEFGVNHISDIAKNEYGTPLISSAFDIVQEKARYNTLCYVNADIIIMEDFVSGIMKINMPSFLLIGLRWDLDIDESIDFSNHQWQENLRNMIKDKGTLQPPLGADYFVFPKWDKIKLPEFAVGRPAWDNWLIFDRWKKRCPIIDASNAITVIHQNHDYAHVPDKEGLKWNGPEAIKNRKLLNNQYISNFTTRDATHIMTSNGVKKAFTREYLRHKWFRIPRLYPRLNFQHIIATKLLRIFWLMFKK